MIIANTGAPVEMSASTPGRGLLKLNSLPISLKFRKKKNKINPANTASKIR